MKRILSTLILSLLLVLLLIPLPASAQSSASLTGKTDLRAGDRLELTFSMSGDGFFGVTCLLSYSEVQVTLESVEGLVEAPWSVEQSGNKILAYDDLLAAPTEGEIALFVATFRIKGTLEPGSEIRISAEQIAASDGVNEESIPSAVYTATIGQPRSSDATLASLSAENATLYPSFQPSVTQYTASVPFSVTSLDLRLEKHHPLAGYRVTGNQLVVGENTIRIRVTAEDGSVRNYSITVTRAQDPNYVPSADAALSALIPSSGALSPAFSSDVTDYVLYLPYESDSITLTGEPVHALASAEEVQATLEVGKNVLSFRVTAEDGSRMTYTVTAVRMPEYFPGDEPILPPPPETTPPETVPPETIPTTTAPATSEPAPETPDQSGRETDPTASESLPLDPEAPKPGLYWAVMALVAVLALGAGALFGFLRWRRL